jgi:adenylate kinase family enzyme
MIKINLYGGPNCGKSTIAASVFVELKSKYINCELVREFAKEMVYEGKDMRDLDEGERLALLAEQLHRERILDGKVDFLITDSPMLLTAFYHNKNYAKKIAVDNLKKNEVHIWLNRIINNYQQEGRSHSLDESLKIDKKMKQYLLSCGINLIEIDGTIKERTDFILSLLTIKDHNNY